MEQSNFSDGHWGAVITSAVGFFGVILTLVCNAYLSRRAQKNQWRHERTRLKDTQKRDRVALRVILLAELRVSREHTRRTLLIYEKAKAPPDGKPTRGAVVPISNTDEIFRISISRIGVLSVPEVERIVEVYAKLRARHAVLRTLHSSAPRNDEFVIVLSENLDSEIRTTADLLGFVDSAIETLKTALASEGLSE